MAYLAKIGKIVALGVYNHLMRIKADIETLHKSVFFKEVHITDLQQCGENDRIEGGDLYSKGTPRTHQVQSRNIVFNIHYLRFQKYCSFQDWNTLFYITALAVLLWGTRIEKVYRKSSQRKIPDTRHFFNNRAKSANTPSKVVFSSLAEWMRTNKTSNNLF